MRLHKSFSSISVASERQSARSREISVSLHQSWTWIGSIHKLGCFKLNRDFRESLRWVGPHNCRGRECRVREKLTPIKFGIEVKIASEVCCAVKTFPIKVYLSLFLNKIIFLSCLNKCIYHRHRSLHPYVALTISTISRGGMKINMSCYRINLEFSP